MGWSFDLTNLGTISTRLGPVELMGIAPLAVKATVYEAAQAHWMKKACCSRAPLQRLGTTPDLGAARDLLS
eukprot:8271950-Prorocentrum_lima.AAC.1